MALLGLAAEAAILLAFLAGSAFFSMSETALIAVNRIQVRGLCQRGDARAIALDRLLDDPEHVLATMLVGNNLANIGGTVYATSVAVGLFGAKGVFVATGVMMVLVILVSEIVPKTFAVQKSLPLALAVARPMRVIEAILRPVVILFSGVAKAVSRPFGVKAKGPAPFITPDEIEMLVRMGVEGGEVAKFEGRVISELFDFTETDVQKVMTPAAKVHFLPRTATLAQAAEMAAREGRTRILVADGDFAHVLGCVHGRDLLRFTDGQLETTPVTAALRGVLFAPADLPADRLLVRMQKEHKLLAVIQDPATRQNLGICTVEDLLEELVGEIHDEFDASRNPAGTPQAGVGPATQSAASTAASTIPR